MFKETPAPDGNFFDTYDVDEMPWPSPTLRSHTTHLDADKDEDVLMDDSDESHSSASDSQDKDDEDESEGGNLEDDLNDNSEGEVLHENGGTDVSKDCVMIETFSIARWRCWNRYGERQWVVVQEV